MRRIQLYLDDDVDDALQAKAQRAGTSKAAVIRGAVARDLGPRSTRQGDPWMAMAGAFDDYLADGQIVDIDDVVYGSKG